MRQLIDSTVHILRSNPHASDGEILDLVMARGVEQPMAMLLVTLLPLAYGRVMLSDTVGAFPDTYICVSDNGHAPRKGSLDALPLWREAVAFAKQDKEPFLHIAGRSCEVRAANAALQDGSRLEDLVWGPPVLNLPVDGLVQNRPRWWRQLWHVPADHSVSHTELIATRVAAVVAILIVVAAVGALIYFSLTA